MPKAIMQDKLNDWLDSIASKYQLWAPQDKDGACLLSPYTPGAPVNLKCRPQLSAKKALFPQTECLLKYQYHKDKSKPEETELSISAANPNQKTVIWGIAPCDVSGISFFENVFIGAGYQDTYFKTRRSNTLIAAIACQHAESTCFCEAVGGSPVSAPDADLLLTRIDHEYVVEALTNEGATLIDEGLFTTVEEAKLNAMQQVKEAALSKLSKPFELGSLPSVADKFLKAFESPYWKEATAACLSCGICTFVCPTCYCFNITDEAQGMHGQRLRCWDACMFSTYTLEASGHNPRNIKFQRYRNRLSHKFSYLITNNNVLGCTGCGRCIKECPVGIDLRSIISHILAE